MIELQNFSKKNVRESAPQRKKSWGARSKKSLAEYLTIQGEGCISTDPPQNDRKQKDSCSHLP